MNHNDKDIVAWQYVTISRNHVLAINVCAKRLLSREIIQQSVDFSSFFMLTIVKASNIKVMVVLRCPKNVNYNVMHTYYISISYWIVIVIYCWACIKCYWKYSHYTHFHVLIVLWLYLFKGNQLYYLNAPIPFKHRCEIIKYN